MSSNPAAAPGGPVHIVSGDPSLEAWRKFVEHHPKGSIFHTPEMVEVFRCTPRHQPFVLAATDNSEELHALVVSVRVQTLRSPFGGFSSRAVFYAEPICTDGAAGIDALTQLIDVHDRTFERNTLFAEVRVLHPPAAEACSLADCGYQHLHYLNFLIDLRREEQEIWKSLSSTCRANIRRARERGLRIEEATDAAGVQVAYSLLEETFQRAKVPLANIHLFHNAVTLLAPLGRIKIFIAYRDREPVGTSVMLLYKGVAYEWYWGAKIIKSLYPAEFLTWHRIEWAKRNGFSVYDFGGAGWPDQPYGVRDFKAKFGGTLVDHGRYRKLFSPWRVRLAQNVYEFRRRMGPH